MAMKPAGAVSAEMRPVRALIGTLPMIVTVSARPRLMAAEVSQALGSLMAMMMASAVATVIPTGITRPKVDSSPFAIASWASVISRRLFGCIRDDEPQV